MRYHLLLILSLSPLFISCGQDKPADASAPSGQTLAPAPDAGTLVVQWNPQDQIGDPRAQSATVPADLVAVHAHETSRIVPSFNGHSMSGMREAYFDLAAGSTIPGHPNIQKIDLQTNEKGVILSLVPDKDYILTFSSDGGFFDVRDAMGKPVHAY